MFHKKRGVQSIYFDSDAVSAAFGTHDLSGVARTGATKILNIRRPTVCALIDNNILMENMGINHTTRGKENESRTMKFKCFQERIFRPANLQWRKKTTQNQCWQALWQVVLRQISVKN